VRAAGTVVLCVWFTLAAAPVGAQTTGKNELTIFGGFSLADATTSASRDPQILALDRSPIPLIYPPIFSVTRTLDGSGELGVRYGRDLTDTLTLTGDFSIAPAHEVLARTSLGCPDTRVCIASPSLGLIAPDFLFSERVVAYHYGGGLAMKLRPGAVTPSVTAGLGGVTFAGDNYRESSLAFRVGGGVSAAVRNLTMGIEVLDVIVSDHFVTSRVEHDPHVRITFGVRW